jgi:L-2-hydroxyglutarate oxidase
VTDIAVIGGGIVGLATALRLQEVRPGLAVTLLEKEDAVAQHQTGRNSGVIHAGIYYAPGSLKAEFCRRGLQMTVAFCREHGLPFDQRGKLIVATSAVEMERMAALHDRATRNGLPLERLDRAALAAREPIIAGLGALFSPATGIVDYGAVCRTMAQLFTARGGDIRLGSRVAAIEEVPEYVTLQLQGGGSVVARHLLVCAGLEADRLAAMCGLADDFRIVPFKGEYFRLAARHDRVVHHMIYPVPDPALPFLGVHLTPMIGGYVTVGPNAVLSLAREGYSKAAFNGRDVADMLGFAGFWRTMAANLRPGLHEARMSLFRRSYLQACRRYCPALELEDLTPHRPGIRAQAVMRDGTLAHDFLIRRTARTIHVCNAPSPAATSAMPIAEHVVAQAVDGFGL